MSLLNRSDAVFEENSMIIAVKAFLKALDLPADKL
jgi:hypothetical protein